MRETPGCPFPDVMLPCIQIAQNITALSCTSDGISCCMRAQTRQDQAFWEAAERFQVCNSRYKQLQRLQVV